MQKWEYKTAKLNTSGWFVSGVLDTNAFDLLLSKLGADSWELVSAFDINQTGGASREAVAVFKRPQN